MVEGQLAGVSTSIDEGLLCDRARQRLCVAYGRERVKSLYGETRLANASKQRAQREIVEADALMARASPTLG
jgi:hypothetical protein